MIILNIDNKKHENLKNIKPYDNHSHYFMLCNPHELLDIENIFKLDESTVVDCLSFDEKIRFISFPHYDFISFIYFWLEKDIIKLSEISLYIASNYVVLVIPELCESIPMEKTIKHILKHAKNLPMGRQGLNKIYYHVFDLIINDFSDILENIEDYINQVEKEIHSNVGNVQFAMITKIKEYIYTMKKQIRPLLYIGDQFIVNENSFITPDFVRFFKNIDIRINKLYDFAVNLQEYASQTLNSYDSRVTMQTNEIVKKLTTLTLFFSPLTIITGVYGMNFEHMPELKWVFGYPASLCLMATVVITIYSILKKKKWL